MFESLSTFVDFSLVMGEYSGGPRVYECRYFEDSAKNKFSIDAIKLNGIASFCLSLMKNGFGAPR